MRRLTSLLILLVAVDAAAESTLRYPETRKVDQTDTYAGGVVVADPYRWLEDDVRETAGVRAWVEAQNQVTFGYLRSLPHRQAIRKRLTEIWDHEKYTIPQKEGGRYFFRKNDGLQNQYVLYVTSSFSESPRVLLDPNAWSKDGTMALGTYSPSRDGRHLAYSVSEAGSDWSVWRVVEIESGKTLPDELKWVKFSGAQWTSDSKGFFYARFPEPPPGAQYQTVNRNQKLYYHRLNTPQSDDVLVYYDAAHPEQRYSPKVTQDGRYLLITTSVTTDRRYRILLKDLTEPYGMPVALVGEFDNEYTFVGNDGPLFYFKTDVDAPRRRLVAIDIRSPQRTNWRVIIPEGPDLLDDVSYVGGRFIAEYLKDARAQARVFSREGRPVRDVEFSTIGSAGGFEGKADDNETFYAFQSVTVPPGIYRYDVATGETKLLFRPSISFDPAAYEVRQIFYRSKDGTQVPMFIAHRKGVRLNGDNPTLLYGYGGFNISQKPVFSISRLVWMDMGGVLAIANLRGGGEYGEQWHKAGTKLQKQNVFDDFIAAAEWLIASRYTRPRRLAIQGGSNGGLLVGAAMTQRPELFGASLPANGVMDMLRFHRFTAGRAWVGDYGSADDPEEFRALYAYSPYHNLRKGTSYPATLVTTADYDDRVVPGHSFKFAAALQDRHAGPAPVLIRIETRAGHGAGKPTSKQIEEIADRWAFLAANLGLKLPRGFGR
ncbi:MAG TPA: prolyl oligopeptidase family serine peptidase [Thermoanaerobaculia bacterium]|nr:prolyl oligopeptidase family serine peptidase [Thermoanaerobaculia bacterium]